MNLEALLPPALAAQMFVVVFLYLLIVRKRMSADYPLYALFLFSLTIYLGGRVAQYFFDHDTSWAINYFRTSFFMGIGVPSLLVVSARQAGFRVGLTAGCLLYGFGIALGFLYVLAHDLRMGRGAFPIEAPFKVRMFHVNLSWWVSSIFMLALPNLYFMFREWRAGRNSTYLASMGGATLFGILWAVGAYQGSARVYYFGSMICAGLWLWAMFEHVRQMKGRTGILKEELESIVQSGSLENRDEIEAKLTEIGKYSSSNLPLYKLRVRDILVTLTHATIRAGGDSDIVIQRSEQRERQITESGDPQQIRDLLRDEAVELAEIVSEVQKEPAILSRAIAYLEKEYQRDLSVDEIAEHLGVSRSYFMREFKRGTDKTVNQYLTELRMDRAKELLGTSKSVTEVAFEVGFNHSSYFSTVFKKHTGVTPQEFKKQYSLS